MRNTQKILLQMQMHTTLCPHATNFFFGDFFPYSNFKIQFHKNKKKKKQCIPDANVSQIANLERNGSYLAGDKQTEEKNTYGFVPQAIFLPKQKKYCIFVLRARSSLT